MKKLVIAIWSMIASFSLLILIAMPLKLNSRGQYFGNPDVLYCKDPYACRHEIGHRMDHDLGYPSMSTDFSMAVRLYVIVQLSESGNAEAYEENSLAYSILSAPGVVGYDKEFSFGGSEMWSSPMMELYASLYANVDGNIGLLPPELQRFYSNDQSYRDTFSCLVVPDRTVTFCDGSVSIMNWQAYTSQ